MRISILLNILLILATLASCYQKKIKGEEKLRSTFEYLPVGGEGVISTDKPDEQIKTKDSGDSIEIYFYKWLGEPIDGYNGECTIKSDTIYLRYWEVIKEIHKDQDHIALMLPSLLKYKIKKRTYKFIKQD